MSWFRRRAKDIATSYRIAFGPVDPRPGPAPADCRADPVPMTSRLAAENAALAARLAEVEAEAYYWRSLASKNDAVDQLAAERDRLAQELEDAVEAMRKAARGPSPASAVTGFLARFPVEEGSHGR